MLLKLFDYGIFCEILCTFAVLFFKKCYYETKILCDNSTVNGFAASFGSSG